MKITILACSLNPRSLSTTLAEYVETHLQGLCPLLTIELIALKNLSLPFANGANQSAYDDPQVKILHDKLLLSQGIIIASPIYNYDVSASCKNLIELTGFKHKHVLSGRSWHKKVVGFIGACGTLRSYMAPMGLFNTLLLDFKSHIFPEFIVASSEDFLGDAPSEALTSRLNMFSHNFLKVAQALSSTTELP